MKKILLISMMMILCLIGIVSAATVVNMDPMGVVVNNSYLDSSVAYNVNVTGNVSNYKCWLYTNENGTNGVGAWHAEVTGFLVANDTNTILTTKTGVADIAGAQYSWAVYCNSTDTSDYSDDWAGTNSTDGSTTIPSGANGLMNFSVDATAPIISMDSPTDFSWDTDGNLTFTANVTDTNAGTCLLGTTMNFSQDSNSTGTWNASSDSEDYTTATAFTYTGMNNNIMIDNGTGAYIYSITCNDSAGNSATSGNRTVYVDKTGPTAFAFNTTLFTTDNVRLWNYTTATDYTPQIGWALTTELNFSRYEIEFYIDGNSTTVKKNVSTISELYTSIGTLLDDQTYQINVTAYDLAGNSQTMTEQGGYYYSTDSTNSELDDGWNVVGNTGNNFTLSQILNWSGATTASIWNDTHEFNSHVASGSYGTYVVKAGTPVFLYMGTGASMSDLVWNATAVDVQGPSSLANQSTSNWNVVMNKNSSDNFEFIDLDLYLNGDKSELFRVNVSSFSLYNNSADIGAKYVSYIGNWSQSMDINSTTMEFGNCAWMYLDLATVATLPMNWSDVK